MKIENITPPTATVYQLTMSLDEIILLRSALGHYIESAPSSVSPNAAKEARYILGPILEVLE